MSDVRDQVPQVWAVPVLVREERSVQEVSEKFTASNGVVISTGAGSQRGGAGFSHSNTLGTLVGGLSKLQLDAFREFFLHERDQELGRWRWPESPQYVVYEDKARCYINQPAVIVFNENDGASAMCGRDGLYSASGIGALDEWCEPAAAAYFDAHPLPKPAWHDAKPGEVWVLTDSEDTKPAFVTDGGRFELEIGYCDLDCEDIIDAKRVWPEVVES